MLAAVRVPVPAVSVSFLFNKLTACTHPVAEISDYLQLILSVYRQVLAHAFKNCSGKLGACTWADNFLTEYNSLSSLIVTLQLHTYLFLSCLCYLLTKARFFYCSDLIGKCFSVFFPLSLHSKALLFHSLSSGSSSVIFLHLLLLVVFFTLCPMLGKVLW